MSEPEIKPPDTTPMYGAPALQPQDQPRVEEPARLGPFARFAGTLLSPGETFEEVNRKPTWIIALVITMVTAIAFMWFLLSHFEEGWRQFMQKAMEGRQSGAALSAQDMDRAFTFTKWGYLVFSGVGTGVFALATAGVFSLGMMLMQAKTTFKKVLSVVAWSWAVTSVLQVAVTVASVLFRGDATSNFNPQDIGRLSASNLGSFMPDGTSAFLQGLASAFDVFSIWFLILLTIGLAAVSGSRKIKSSSVAPMVFGLWIVSVLIRASLAAAFGS